MLERGRDGRYLRMLAGMTPPYNKFELADYRDRSLKELDLAEITESDAVTTYAIEQLRLAISGEIEFIDALKVLKDLCIARDNQKDIYDFYLLYYAYSDLQESDVQWYWNGATRSNIVALIRERAEAFIDQHRAIEM